MRYMKTNNLVLFVTLNFNKLLNYFYLACKLSSTPKSVSAFSNFFSFWNIT